MTGRNEFSTVKKIVLLQVLIALLVTSGFLLLEGWEGAVSPLSGALVAIIPNAFFALRIFLKRNAKVQQIVRSFYVSESIKIVLTFVLFAMVFQLPGINLLTVLAGYVSVLSAFWFALLVWRE